MAFSTLSANRFSPPSFPHSTSSSSNRTSTRTRVSADPKPKLVSLDPIETFPTERVGINGRKSDSHVEKSKDCISEQLGLMYDDGYGTASVIDYLDATKEMIRPDGGPPRWFCPIECGPPIKGSPILLFLPGVDGLGLGLILHHRSLGKVFEVRCMHTPVYDRTPFEGLLKFVEETVRLEHSASPNKPIYLVGDSFGGSLALAVAARNPAIDLMLILSNPATSFSKSQLQPFLPVLEAMPNELHNIVPYILSFTMGDPLKLGMASVEKEIPPSQTLVELSRSLTSMLPRLSDLADLLPKETLLWRLKLLKSASSYANSRLHAVKAEVLVLASGKDNMLPSRDEAQRLWDSLRNCKVRYFKDHGHTLLLEDGIHLLTVIKGTQMYRRSRKYDYVLDYLPPTRTEFVDAFEKGEVWFKQATCPVVLSTMKDGKIVRGLGGVPDEGPVLLVGYHMLFGLELAPLVEAFLREKNVLVRASNLFRLLSSKSFALLYPGGAREALHRKGEEYKLFWPDQPEFVRMAARFGATIVPFGVVGEDDIVELVLDYNDQMSIPYVRDWIKDMNEGSPRLRSETNGEVANQDFFLPVVLPKIPGRFYYLFGKPVETKGRMEMLKDRENATEVYSQIKSEIESAMSYLRKKREEDPYRSILQRTIYQATWGSDRPVPTFEP
ncbi:acyltransferase-like protein, chloroplastic [Cinnamomum micranthum f. kanehirae]|uniref:Acyltransferase-like protein, chloroplastic n=1 Tax=Cinnamomum micranthum f. kanehirae TaxID=337451 RepID=A0A443PTL9_9MAGN|nr:acyltransferase-like protein, chloroplastic [Cinnamomum micranthum f. kanehirae]